MSQRTRAVQEMQNYIEKNLFEAITPAKLSEISHYSPWYASKLFEERTGTTPSNYIRRLRLAKSALILRDNKEAKVTDVAFLVGFGSVDGYQRAFRREFNVNPADYAKNPVPIYLFTPYAVEDKTRERRIQMERSKNIFIKEVEKPERKVIIKRGVNAEEYMPYCEEVGCEVWGLLKSIKSLDGEPVCLRLPDSYIKKGTSRYVQGAEVSPDYGGEIPEGFDVISLPKAMYLMFQGEKFNEEDYCEAITEVKDAVKKYDPALIGYEWDRENPLIELEPIGERGYIELIPVKKLR